MRIHPARVSALIAVFAALAITLPATASQDTGGTAAEQQPPVQPSGGVIGPAVKDGARSAQTPAPAQEDGPQIEEPPPPNTENIPDEETGPEANGKETPAGGDEGANAPAAAAPSSGGGGGGLPTTGLEIGALTAVGLGLLLAGVALRRRPA